MRRTQRRLHSRGKQLYAALTVLAVATSPCALAEEIQVDRYASMRPVPTQEQADLLSVKVSVQFPALIVLVGQAVEYLLQPSGYRLASDAVADPARGILLRLPFPEPHRALGPMPMRTALETLAGPAFRLVEDPLHRLVSFERCVPQGPRSAAPPTLETR